MHHINPAKLPPAELLQTARQLAVTAKRPVYLYQYSGGWGFTAKLTKVPAGALITEIKGNADASELWNTGGC